MTASDLLAMSKGIGMDARGGGKCFYCGTPCDPIMPVADYRSDSFTGWTEVAFPDSQWICWGCAASLDERVAVPWADKPQKSRGMAWVIESTQATALSMYDPGPLRTICLQPPPVPFAIILPTGGKKHLIYRAPVNFSCGVVEVQLELERVVYRPSELSARLELAMRFAAAAGKPTLLEPPSGRIAIRVGDYWRDEAERVLGWYDVAGEPLSRLAARLCPAMKECQNEHPIHNVAEV